MLQPTQQNTIIKKTKPTDDLQDFIVKRAISLNRWGFLGIITIIYCGFHYIFLECLPDIESIIIVFSLLLLSIFASTIPWQGHKSSNVFKSIRTISGKILLYASIYTIPVTIAEYLGSRLSNGDPDSINTMLFGNFFSSILVFLTIGYCIAFFENESNKMSSSTNETRAFEWANHGKNLPPGMLIDVIERQLNERNHRHTKDALITISNLYTSWLLNFNSPLITVDEEFEFLKKYLTIVRKFFNKTINIQWVIEEGALCHRIPPLILHPIIETLIDSGYTSLEIHLKIEAYHTGGLLEIWTPKSGKIIISHPIWVDTTKRLQAVFGKSDYILLGDTINDKFIISIGTISR
ncbi:hypothetical protein [Geothrix sp. PMB-07]|uniref:hypothetical protein n=1 Tax=Geothrix sp. PMB-07 TaxID=3068640 RepID=UPI0027421A0A|nr:hypothetical protein [Geothrix sp. PMB-07]WLT30921.1 hypothetical protein Q9293_14485 [Geothrix sp. PMB-07]